MSWSSPCQDSLLECQLHWLRWSYHSLHNLIFLSLTLKSFNHTLWAKVYEKSTAILKRKSFNKFSFKHFLKFFFFENIFVVFRGLHAVWEENTLIFKPFRFALFFPIFSPLYCDDPSYQHQPQIVISSTPSLHFSSLYWTTVGRICIEKNYTYLSILRVCMKKIFNTDSWI